MKNEIGQVLRGAMCLLSRTVKWAYVSTNELNECFEKLQKGIFKKKSISNASPNSKYKFFPNPNWNHTKNSLINKRIKDPTKSPKRATKGTTKFFQRHKSHPNSN